MSSSCVADDICYATNVATDLRGDVGGEDDFRSFCAGGQIVMLLLGCARPAGIATKYREVMKSIL